MQLTGDRSLATRLPGVSDPEQAVHNARTLDTMLLAEAALLVLLAGLLLLRGAWLRGGGGLALLERHARKVLVLLFLLHVLSMLFHLPLVDIASPEPVVTCDNAYHYYQVVAMDHFMSHDNHRWGYDPYFMAGYPAGVIFDIDMKGAELFCHLLAGIGLQHAQKAYILLSILLLPWAIYAAARLFRLQPSAALVALLLSLLFWHWGRPLIGHFKWAGMQSYVFASYLAVLALALFHRFLDRDHRGRVLLYLALVTLVAAAAEIHPLAGLLLAPGFLVGYVASLRHLRPRDHLVLWLGLALVLAANSDWILSYFRFRHYKTASNLFFQLQGFRDLVFLYTRKTSILFMAITLLGIPGLVLLGRGSRRTTLVIGASAMLYLIAAFFGSRLPTLANTEPGRYVVPFVFLMSIPAGHALVALLRRAEDPARPHLTAVLFVLAASCMPLLSAVDNRFFYANRLSARIDPRFHELLRFLQENTTPRARILFETPGGFDNSSELIYGGHLQALVPIYTRREVIGGPYPTNFLVHSTVDFKNGELLGRPLSDWQADRFSEFLDTYNIGWVASWSEEAHTYLDAHADLVQLVGEIDRFRVYAAQRQPSYVLEGGGRVTAGYNRIAVAEAAGEELVLKYHWLESLRSSPELPLERYPIPGDPVGFIRVRPQGTTDFTILNSYSMRKP